MTEFILMQTELFFRMVLAAICGAIIGYERKSRGKEAGIRTHLVVATASALMMIISKYGFSDITNILFGNVAEYRLDPSRLAAQIVSGVGFLGAGMIYIHGKTPHGLTTAAGIWATAGIGMAIGSGMYVMGFLATALIFVAHLLLHKDFSFLRSAKEERISLIIDDDKEAITAVQSLLAEKGLQVDDLSLKRLENFTIRLDLTISTMQTFDSTALLALVTESPYIKEIETRKS